MKYYNKSDTVTIGEHECKIYSTCSGNEYFLSSSSNSNIYKQFGLSKSQLVHRINDSGNFPYHSSLDNLNKTIEFLKGFEKVEENKPTNRVYKWGPNGSFYYITNNNVRYGFDRNGNWRINNTLNHLQENEGWVEVKYGSFDCDKWFKMLEQEAVKRGYEIGKTYESPNHPKKFTIERFNNAESDFKKGEFYALNGDHPLKLLDNGKWNIYPKIKSDEKPIEPKSKPMKDYNKLYKSTAGSFLFFKNNTDGYGFSTGTTWYNCHSGWGNLQHDNWSLVSSKSDHNIFFNLLKKEAIKRGYSPDLNWDYNHNDWDGTSFGECSFWVRGHNGSQHIILEYGKWKEPISKLKPIKKTGNIETSGINPCDDVRLKPDIYYGTSGTPKSVDIFESTVLKSKKRKKKFRT